MLREKCRPPDSRRPPAFTACNDESDFLNGEAHYNRMKSRRVQLRLAETPAAHQQLRKKRGIATAPNGATISQVAAGQRLTLART